MFCAVFWNIGGQPPRSGIVRLVTALQRQEDADVIVLAECSDGVIGSTLRALNPSGQSLNFDLVPTTSRVKVLTRRTVSRTSEIDRHEYYSVLKVVRGGQPDLLLTAVHMVSLLEKDAPHIDKELEKLADAIRSAEEATGHDRTVVIGDLNAHPFSDGVASSVGLHGIMSRSVAGRGERQASHRRYPFFFNPMWQFYGDATATPAGTYYREPGGAHTGYYWHLFDQVLIRPSLRPYYRDDSVCIVTSVGGTTLAGPDLVPNRRIGSDHYPIRVRLTD
ncbi:endonuclease/exonuclease/phosphatase family protein [Gemmata sp. G18]|uniref:Endonuclease/exonuclease/phosphatase family protein n=1 Tax=Gemmata palustris TaxID=2822762 RepID=A0ABS5BSV5_9BACT|nr:endonuclease/exonuclease/phosphatase family protein [Gemmata palustris]MBP3956815.1 endonuclease/exonuclease/phosphatase family protein [Gemmata palustris]